MLKNISLSLLIITLAYSNTGLTSDQNLFDVNSYKKQAVIIECLENKNGCLVLEESAQPATTLLRLNRHLVGHIMSFTDLTSAASFSSTSRKSFEIMGSLRNSRPLWEAFWCEHMYEIEIIAIPLRESDCDRGISARFTPVRKVHKFPDFYLNYPIRYLSVLKATLINTVFPRYINSVQPVVGEQLENAIITIGDGTITLIPKDRKYG